MIFPCRKLSLSRQIACHSCNGSGTKSGKSYECPKCHGSGVETIVRQIGPGMLSQMQRPCSHCHGKGTVIPPGELVAHAVSVIIKLCQTFLTKSICFSGVYLCVRLLTAPYWMGA